MKCWYIPLRGRHPLFKIARDNVLYRYDSQWHGTDKGTRRHIGTARQNAVFSIWLSSAPKRPGNECRRARNASSLRKREERRPFLDISDKPVAHKVFVLSRFRIMKDDYASTKRVVMVRTHIDRPPTHFLSTAKGILKGSLDWYHAQCISCSLRYFLSSGVRQLRLRLV